MTDERTCFMPKMPFEDEIAAHRQNADRMRAEFAERIAAHFIASIALTAAMHEADPNPERACTSLIAFCDSLREHARTRFVAMSATTTE